eukprot:Nitzschia sp. Nitz4//scaffold142_size57810//11162//17644//NITZ4_006492-RA/size57810-augustus-gene-0.32-mRNA-1//-1//CDS//3329536379//6860//frame0
MAVTKRRRPDVDHCSQTLQKLREPYSNHTPKTLAEIYTSGVGLLYHLKIDQVTISQIRKQHDGKDNILFPKTNAIPAISAVIHNQDLFNALVTCLSASPSDIEAAEGAARLQPGSRKRTAPIDGIGPSDGFVPKSIKVAMSPQVSNKRSQSAFAKPQMNVKVLAATILFVAFEHLDHWPSPLIRAYADDCFGPRSWVDEPTCQVFVENLALSYKKIPSEDEPMIDAGCMEDAAAMAKFFKKAYEDHSTHSSADTSPVKRSESFSSVTQTNTGSLPQLGRVRSPSKDMSNETFPPIGNAKSKELSPSPSKGKRPQPEDDESDSGEDEEVVIGQSLSKSVEDDGESSSSGEEDEEVVVSSKAVDGIAHPSQENDGPPTLVQSYPVVQKHLNFSRVRQRYFGDNLVQAHLAFTLSLNDRLDIRTKQNSGLLQCLPDFTSIPGVRRLISASLEKWLQSPALAGLARSLFAQTVQMMENVDPPLPEDLHSIENILSMKLKANQLNAHVENITAIAQRIPTASTSRQIHGKLFESVLLSMDSADGSVSDYLKMVHAVKSVSSDEHTASGMAAALMSLLGTKPVALEQLSHDTYVRRICDLIRLVARELGQEFRGCKLLEAMAFHQIEDATSWSILQEETRGRLLFQCATLLVQNHVHEIQTDTVSNGDTKGFRMQLVSAKKILLRWGCLQYAPLCAPRLSQANPSRGETSAGDVDYTSILDGINKDFPSWLKTLRCVLFLEDPKSVTLQKFVSSEYMSLQNSPEWRDELSRIEICTQHGTDVNDDMIWIVVNSVVKDMVTSPEVAVPLLEHLFNGCNKDNPGSLMVTDPSLLEQLYKMVQYSPPDPQKTHKHNNSENGVSDNNEDVELPDIPKLAYPGLWWRVTCLALVMCGSSPDKVGATAWESNPTLKSLIKMVTSDRYRFPTVDCDDSQRDNMKKTEQGMRDEEARIAEILFLPRKPKKKTQKPQVTEVVGRTGSRTSSRIRKDKQERALKKQREKEAAEALKESQRRKKLLRFAQKSIMLWDPAKGPRKPPKESADLIFSVGELFDLSRVFQRSSSPDFVLATIGNTTRDAIERAYDWLIPVVSFLPEIISRLPASASCFLLLRAYGTEGDERKQLQELSAPLLFHVRQSLVGKFGEASCVRAFDLLLSDVASHNPDRRRCARRVLQDAVGREYESEVEHPFVNSRCAWMVITMKLPHSKSILPDVLRHFSRAATFERGRVLRYLILALHKLAAFPMDTDVSGFDFPTLLVDLISSRPTVFASTMDLFADLRDLALDVVHGEFVKEKVEAQDACDLILCCKPPGFEEGEALKVSLPLALLESACVLLSISQDDAEANGGKSAVVGLVRMLMKTANEDKSCEEKPLGLASAKFASTGNDAIPVESWVMLARSRSDFIAKRAALTAPNGFLPRLLLCSGLPKASLVSMIDRLGKLGDNSDDVEKLYSQLLVPSATSEWDIGRLGRKKDISRKLLGRLSAYTQMHELPKLLSGSSVSLTFVSWLGGCHFAVEKPRKPKSKNQKNAVPKLYSCIGTVENVLESCTDDILQSLLPQEVSLDGDASDMTEFLNCQSSMVSTKPMSLDDPICTLEFVQSLFESNQSTQLEQWLSTLCCSQNFSKFSPDLMFGNSEWEERRTTVAILLLQSFRDLERKTEDIGAAIVKWIPLLSTTTGNPDLWKLVFARGQKPSFLWDNLASRCFQTWSQDHLSTCRKWILSSEDAASLDLEKLIWLLIQASTIDATFLSKRVSVTPSMVGSEWMSEPESAQKAITLALKVLVEANGNELRHRLRTRNDLPDALTLILLICRNGRKQVEMAGRMVVGMMEKNSEKSLREVFLSVMLRLYASFPHSMNLGAAILRSVLKEAVEAMAVDWKHWRSPMDDQYEDLLQTCATSGPQPRLAQALVDAAKKHPLLLLRKLANMGRLLEEDATAQSPSVDRRGVIYGYALTPPAPAKVDGKIVKVTVRHWGFNFTDSIWASFLEIISSVPNEVLFGCGLCMGLGEFLEGYLRLMSVQTQLRTSGDRLTKLKGSLSTFLASFKKSNASGYEKWLAKEVTGLSSLGSVRNVLMSCDFISHQEAIESVKNARSST